MMDSGESGFGALLRRLRIERRLSQEALAERAKMSVAAISALERGSRQSPYRSSVDLLADGLGIDGEMRTQLHALAEQWRKTRALPSKSVGPSAGSPPSPSAPNNLPLQLTSFIGREREVTAVKDLLQRSRLVTLVGTGGVGKTRCALEAGAESLDVFPDGVWLVELAPVSDSSVVASEVARALGVWERQGDTGLPELLMHLKQRRTLIILDSCERVIEEVRSATAAILRACPDVRLLITSRESLNIRGERVFELPTLAVPLADETLTAETAARYGSVALFADRASASDGRFALAVDNVPFVTDICRRLDGIPLAIELAAARVKVLSLPQLLLKLDERFRVLTNGDRSALPRHQTMRALIDWSYDGLSGDERALFRKLSIFAGGFTLETVAAACADETIDEINILDLLASLVDKSLVQADPAGEVARYRMLDSTREYSREKLVASGGYQDVARAHAAAFLALAERLEEAYDSTPDDEWFARCALELENWRSALEFSFTVEGEVLVAQRLASALRRVWSGLAAADGRRWLEAAQDKLNATTPEAVVARLDLAEAALSSTMLRYRACQAAADRALTHFRALDHGLGIAEAERLSGSALVALGQNAEGLAVLNRALERARSMGARKLTAAVLDCMADARHRSGDSAGARTLYTEALEIYKDVGADASAAAGVMTNLAEAEFRGGDAVVALRLANEALAARRALHHTSAVAHTLCNVAAYLVALGRYDEACPPAREALVLAHSLHSEVMVLFAMQHLAAVGTSRSSESAEASRENRKRAARLIGYIDMRLAAVDALREYTEQREYESTISALEIALDGLPELINQGRAWSEDRAMSEAMAVARMQGGGCDPCQGEAPS